MCPVAKQCQTLIHHGVYVWQVASLLVVVKAVAHDEVVWNLHRGILYVEVNRQFVRLHQQRADVYDSFGGEHKGVIFDGFPRTIPQAEALKEMLAHRGHTIAAMIELDADTVVIDGLFGSGLTKPLAGGFASLVKIFITMQKYKKNEYKSPKFRNNFMFSLLKR